MPEEVGIILDNLESVGSVNLRFKLYSVVLDNSREILLTIGWSG